MTKNEINNDADRDAGQIHIAQDIQYKDGNKYIVATIYDGKPLHVFCRGTGFSTGVGPAYTPRPISDFSVGNTIRADRDMLYRVTGIGAVHEVTIKLGVIDEDHSMSGFRATGETRKDLNQRIYLERI